MCKVKPTSRNDQFITEDSASSCCRGFSDDLGWLKLRDQLVKHTKHRLVKCSCLAWHKRKTNGKRVFCVSDKNGEQLVTEITRALSLQLSVSYRSRFFNSYFFHSCIFRAPLVGWYSSLLRLAIRIAIYCVISSWWVQVSLKEDLWSRIVVYLFLVIYVIYHPGLYELTLRPHGHLDKSYSRCSPWEGLSLPWRRNLVGPEPLTNCSPSSRQYTITKTTGAKSNYATYCELIMRAFNYRLGPK